MRLLGKSRKKYHGSIMKYIEVSLKIALCTRKDN